MYEASAIPTSLLLLSVGPILVGFPVNPSVLLQPAREWNPPTFISDPSKCPFLGPVNESGKDLWSMLLGLPIRATYGPFVFARWDRHVKAGVRLSFETRVHLHR